MKGSGSIFKGMLLFALAYFQSNCWAGNNFYTEQIPVTQQSPEARAKAAAIGLKAVLWRVTGSRVTEQTPGLASAFNQAETYLDSFQYAHADTEPLQQQVVLQYSPRAISQLTQTYRLPYWPENRPKVLVWLIQSKDGQPSRFIKDANDPSVIRLQEAARLRGLSLVFPNLDADDAAAISPAQILNNDNEALMNASFRYGLDTLLVGVLTGDTSRWMFDHRGEKQSLSSTDPSAGLHALADTLAKLYALNPATRITANSTAVISVDNLNFVTYYHLINYLKNHAQVTSVNLLKAQPDHLLLTLNLRGNLQQFDKALSIDRQLEALQPNQGAAGSLENPVAYHWLAN